MKKTECAIIEDLMPLYAEGLASEASARMIEEHIKECEECRSKLARMKAEEPARDPDDSMAIDVLKKNRRNNRRTLIVSLCAAAVVIASVLGIRFWITGDRLSAGSLACDIQVHEEGNRIAADFMVVDSLHVIRDVRFAEEDGIVTITVTGVADGIWHGNTFHQEYTASSPVRQVRINDTVIWDHGERIFSPTADVFATVHDFVGDMSANIATANALNLSGRFGPYKSELITDKEPYRWRILLEEDIAPADYWKESDMRRCACILIGVIGNLSEVEFVYTVGGEEVSVLVTKKEADEILGQDVKNCMTDIGLLNRLISIAGITESIRTWSCEQFSFDYPSFCDLKEVKQENTGDTSRYITGSWILRDEERQVTVAVTQLKKNNDSEYDLFYRWTLEDLVNTHSHTIGGNAQNEVRNAWTVKYKQTDEYTVSFASVPNSYNGISESDIYEVIYAADRGDEFWDVRIVIPIEDLGSVHRWLETVRHIRFLQ